MINSKEDYLFYLAADRIALRARFPHPRLFNDEIWKFQRRLRQVEFFENCRKYRLNPISYYFARYNLHRLSLQLGFTIPCNVFGPGLSIAHRGTIVVSPSAKVGENCRILQGVTIGIARKGDIAPSIGNNVFIGPGAVILGAVTIADGIAIGANSYVDKSFTEPNITLAGCPARKISNKSSEDLWLRATDILRGNTKQISC
ncbi:MAG: serine acetyltransferase [Candidatus Bathyarchaeia archaeon]